MKGVYLLSTTNTHKMLIRNASRRDALVGVVDDYLIRYTRGMMKTNKRPQAPGETKSLRWTWKRTGIKRLWCGKRHHDQNEP